MFQGIDTTNIETGFVSDIVHGKKWKELFAFSLIAS